MVCDNQRVKTGQMPPGLTQNMIRVSILHKVSLTV